MLAGCWQVWPRLLLLTILAGCHMTEATSSSWQSQAEVTSLLAAFNDALIEPNDAFCYLSSRIQLTSTIIVYLICHAAKILCTLQTVQTVACKISL